jgi:hypothetical protein
MEAVIGTIGVVTIGSIVGSISTVSSSIYSIVTNIKVNKDIHNKDILNILEKTDVIATIKLLQSIMSEIPDIYINSISVVMALKNVHEIIEQIENELIDMHKKIDYNNNLYIMSNWRSYDFKDNLESIEKKINILDRRKDNLFKILETFKNLNIKSNDENKKKVLNFLKNNDFEIIDNNYLIKNNKLLELEY